MVCYLEWEDGRGERRWVRTECGRRKAFPSRDAAEQQGSRMVAIGLAKRYRVEERQPRDTPSLKSPQSLEFTEVP